MKKWFLALLTTLMALMLSVASAENVPLASETEINPVLEAQTLVGLKIPVEAFKETTKGGEVISAEITTSETDAEVQYVNVFGYIYPVDESAPNIEWRDEVEWTFCSAGRRREQRLDSQTDRHGFCWRRNCD